MNADNIDANIGPAVREAFGPLIDNPILSEAIRRPRPSTIIIEPAQQRTKCYVVLELDCPPNETDIFREQEAHDDELRDRITDAYIVRQLQDRTADVERICFERGEVGL